jgi:hypothetical protein
MNYARLLSLLPLAYIVWWFYELITWIIPAASGSVSGIVNASWIELICIILFFSGGLVLLIIAFIAFFIILLAD